MHVLVSCPKLRTPRHRLQKKVGDALDSISLMLGGTPHNEQGNVTGRSINREVVNAVLDFTDASQRFRTRAPEGSQRRAEDKEHDIGPNEAQTSLVKWNKYTIDFQG
jgi:hypothetical protein